MILVDSSAWVEFDRATGSLTDERLAALIADDAAIANTEPVLMEVLAGATSRQGAQQLRRLLTSFLWIPVEPAADFEGAAKVYRECRRAGITPRSLIDCMIASIALRAGARVLASDRDFEALATVLPLSLEPVD